MGLRVTFVTLMLGLSLIFQATKGERVDTFYTLIVLTYALTIPSAVLLRTLKTPSASPRSSGFKSASIFSSKLCWSRALEESRVPSRSSM